MVASFRFLALELSYWSSSESQSLAILFTTLTGPPESLEVSGNETGGVDVEDEGGGATICGDITTMPGCIMEVAGTSTCGPQVC